MRTKLSALAGTWYAADPGVLRRDVDGWLAAAGAAPRPHPTAIVVPHAGYRYSGAVAAAAYRCLQGESYERVAILAPSHRAAFRGVAVLDAEAFATPLGEVAIDPAAAALAGGGVLRRDAAPFQGEHALEIQLPFLQRTLPAASVVPLLCGTMKAADRTAFAKILAKLADGRTAFVVSSDFTHYGRHFGYQPFPATSAKEVRARLRALDMGAIEPLVRGDAAGFARYVEETGATVCGRVPVLAFLTWSGGEHSGRLLAYRTSLDVTGDYEHVVSYAAIAFFPTPEKS